jgi:hypothetical protein
VALRGPWRSLPWRSLPWGLIAAVGAYFVVALVANWPAWPGDPDRVRTVTSFAVTGSTDNDLMTWFLAWVPHALAHGLNPLYTNWLNYPYGVDVAQNTSAPLLGLLAAPLTLLVNPIASFNLLVFLAYPLSATAMFFVLRRFVQWDVAAFAGGALYGFSPWVVDQSLYHLNLCFVPLPPVMLLACYELLRRDQAKPTRWGVALGALVVLQFFISPEILAITVMMAVIGAVFLALLSPFEVARCLRRAWRGIAAIAVICYVFLAYPLHAMFTGPYHFVGTPNPGGEGADLLSPFLPTSLERLSLGHLGVIGQNLVFQNTSENGGYLGVPLIALLILFVVLFGRRPWVKFSALMTAVAFVLSLGQKLVVDSHVTGILLPYYLVQNQRIFNSILQVRIGLMVPLFAGLLVALGMDEMHARSSPGGRLSSGPGGSGARIAAPTRWTLWGLGALSLATLIPSFPLPTSSSTVPHYFASPAVQRIPVDSVVLISPYPSVFDPVGQLWQAVAGDRFKIIGGYSLFSSGGPAGNVPSPYPPTLKPPDVEMFLTGAADGTPYLGGPIPAVNRRLVCDLQTFLTAQHVGTVLSGPIPSSFASDPRSIARLFRRALGAPSQVDGSITAWYDVALDIANTSASQGCGTG